MSTNHSSHFSIGKINRKISEIKKQRYRSTSILCQTLIYLKSLLREGISAGVSLTYLRYSGSVPHLLIPDFSSIGIPLSYKCNNRSCDLPGFTNDNIPAPIASRRSPATTAVGWNVHAFTNCLMTHQSYLFTSTSRILLLASAVVPNAA